MKKGRFVALKRAVRKSLSVLLCFTLAISLFPGISMGQSMGQSSDNVHEGTGTNGALMVYLLKDNQWQAAGTLGFSKSLTDQTLDLNGLPGSGEPVRIRLVQNGGGAAHLDSVFLGEAQPVKVNSQQGLLLDKVLQKDLDLINIEQNGVELAFDQVLQHGRLVVTARIEGTDISKIPFQFPKENSYRQIDQNSKFYTYSLNTEQASPRDGSMAELVSKQTPFFKEYVVPGSGHPAGYIYGWVMNDQKNLYVAQEFTPDNTMDGDKDYAKVYVKTGAGLKEFKVSLPETKWGKAYFIYTDKVGYQHKFYEFAIPLSAIGIAEGVVSGNLQLAFAGYGTMSMPSVSKQNPAVAYNPSANNYLSVFEYYSSNYESEHTDVKIQAQLVNAEGNPITSPITSPLDLSNSLTNHRGNPAVAYNPKTNQYLAVWDDYRSVLYEVYGQLINADGTLAGGNFLISSAGSYDSSSPSITCDGTSGNFLIAWSSRLDVETDNYDAWGQLVDKDGSLTGSNFVISNAANKQQAVALAFDTTNQKYLAVWQDDRNESADYAIYGQFVTTGGVLDGQNFAVSDGTAPQDQPALAFDSINNRFLAAWSDYRNQSQEEDIYARFINTNGSLVGSDFALVNSDYSDREPEIVFNSANPGFLLLWGAESDGVDIVGQFLGTNGSPRGDSMEIKHNARGDYAAAFNSQEGNFLAAADRYYPADISYSVLTDNQPYIYFGEPMLSVQENGGSVFAKVYRSGSSEEVAYAVYNCRDITAVAGADYGSVTGTVYFYKGETSKTIEVPINVDSLSESEETFELFLTSPVDADLGSPNKTIIKIVDNQSPSPSGGGGGSSSEIAPDGGLIDRMSGSVALAYSVKIDWVKKEIILDYDSRISKGKTNCSPRVYYWNNNFRKWVALPSYITEEGKIKALNEPGYVGWFRVYGVVQPEFTDVNKHWAEPVANRMNGLGMLEGYPGAQGGLVRTAKLENNVTRAEFTVFLNRLLNIDSDKPMLPLLSKEQAKGILQAKFQDAVTVPDWALSEVAAVVDVGLAVGKSGKFYANEPISRIEAAVMVSNALKTLPGYKKGDLGIFKDSTDIPEWAKAAVVDNLVNGYPDGTLRPNENISRGEALTVFLKLFVNGMGW